MDIISLSNIRIIICAEECKLKLRKLNFLISVLLFEPNENYQEVLAFLYNRLSTES